MKLSTLFAATVLATAGFGAAAYAQQTSVSPTNQDVPGSTSQENNAEALQRQGVAEQSGAAVDAPSTTPGCQVPVGSQDSGIQECEEADRAAVAAGTSATGQTVGPDGSTDPGTTSAVQELPTDASGATEATDPTNQDVPGSTSLENNAETIERDQVAQ